MNRRAIRGLAISLAGIGMAPGAWAQTAMTEFASGAYLDLESVSSNDTFGASQQAGGVFLQGGLLNAGACPASSPNCSNAYQNVSASATEYYYSTTNGWTNGLTKPLTFAGSGNQIGFTVPTSSVALGVGVPTEAWNINVNPAAGVAFTPQTLQTPQISTLGATNYPSQAFVTPFVNNVAVNTTFNSQNGVLNPTFSWSQSSTWQTIAANGGPNGPNAIRIEIWQLGTNGSQSTDVFNTTLTGNATSFSVPTNIGLTTGTRYSIDVEDLVLRNPGDTADTTNVNVLTRSRSLFDFELLNASSLPSGTNATTIAEAMVNPTGSSTGGVTYSFNEAVKAGQQMLVDPLAATGYLYKTGAGDPNFASVTLPSVPGSAYELFLMNSSGQYVDSGQSLVAGQKYNFGGNGVSSFEVQGINPAAGLDPNNASAFVTALSFTSDGTFTGTMTPLTTPLPAGIWLLLSGLGALGFTGRKRSAD